ncbi:MAG TPA: hypothetical protein VGC72_12670 [Candidatus Elarobacter sp.]|jgi:hypothetical protein
MGLSFFRTAIGSVIVFTIALGAVPAFAAANVLATAQGIIVISEARTGLRAPSCSELVVEARDALDNHLIAETRPTTDDAGTCGYALSVPAQTAVWLRAQPVLIAGARIIAGVNTNRVGAGRTSSSSASVALRFTIIAPTTYFFEPNERKSIQLSY